MESITAETDRTKISVPSLVQVAAVSTSLEPVVLEFLTCLQLDLWVQQYQEQLADTKLVSQTNGDVLVANASAPLDNVTETLTASMAQTSSNAPDSQPLDLDPRKSILAVLATLVKVMRSAADLENSLVRIADNVFPRIDCATRSPIVLSRKMNKTVKSLRINQLAR